MMNTIPVGVLYSSQSQYRKVSYQTLIGTQFGIAQVNANPHFDFKLGAVHKDPFGQKNTYINHARQLQKQGIEHLFGTTTIDSRLRVLESMEGDSALLWSSALSGKQQHIDSLVEFGASPDSYLLPLLEYAFQEEGTKCAIVSPNDQLGWELSEMTTSYVKTGGGTLTFDNYYREGCRTFHYTIRSLLTHRPDFVVNHLMGEASYAFLTELNRDWDGCPLTVLCSHMSRSESVALGKLDKIRVLNASCFFEPVNPLFTQRVYRDLSKVYVSGGFVSAYLSVLAFGYAVNLAKSTEPSVVRQALGKVHLPTPFGDSVSVIEQRIELPTYLAELSGDNVTLIQASSDISMRPAHTAKSNRLVLE
ncbi:transporter substrate-binding protein [Vibrio nigripulchritudo]|uniref:transporter substrate-binding protein n=1 Tax=Vibrio nigripulchritudo TaxID=28173 RepID=UPI00056EBCF3|nr:transporter substrate-binding protein [Vibrio nigripulchritudo]